MLLTGFLEVGLSSLSDSRSILEGSLLTVVSRICLQCGENIISGMLYALLGVSAMTRVRHILGWAMPECILCFCRLMSCAFIYWTSARAHNMNAKHFFFGLGTCLVWWIIWLVFEGYLVESWQVHKATMILQQLAALCYLSVGTENKLPLQWSSLQGWLVAAVSLMHLALFCFNDDSLWSLWTSFLHLLLCCGWEEPLWFHFLHHALYLVLWRTQYQNMMKGLGFRV